jgi:hypothetical protein
VGRQRRTHQARVANSEPEGIMKILTTLITTIFVCAAVAGSAVAQTPAPAPAGKTTAAAPASAEKKAVSKACSDQADAKGLHGKERKKFRSECKRNGGKAS